MRALAFLAAAIVASAAGAEPAFDFDAAVKQAQQNEATESGRAYQKPFFDGFVPAIQKLMEKCFGMTPEDVGTKFTLVFRVGAEGSIDELHARPQTASVTCVLEGVKTVRVATPPRPDWWVFIDMTITE